MKNSTHIFIMCKSWKVKRVLEIIVKPPLYLPKFQLLRPVPQEFDQLSGHQRDHIDKYKSIIKEGSKEVISCSSYTKHIFFLEACF